MVDRSKGMLFGGKYEAIEQLEDEAESIRPAAKHVKAMKMRDELDAAGRIKSLKAVKAELDKRKAKVNAELARLQKRNPTILQAHRG